MILTILKEISDKRVALTPEIAKKVADKLKVSIMVEKGAGDESFFKDEQYKENGTKIVSRKDALQQADIVSTIEPLPHQDLKLLKDEAFVLSSFAPYNNPNIKKELSAFSKQYFFSLDMLPRSTRAQSMDILSSMASLAGYQAVVEAANYLQRYFPMFITSAGTIKPAQVLVVGAGVAGLQAVATAKRLGAVVTAMDTRSAAEDEVKSLGGKFFKIEGAQDATKHGYGAEQSEEFIQKQRELTHNLVQSMDIVICTAVIRGRKAPVIINKAMVKTMKNGSVIVDLASATGGNCELTKDNETISAEGCTIIGNSKLAEKKSTDASTLYSNNMFNFISLLLSKDKPDFDDEIIKETCISKPQ